MRYKNRESPVREVGEERLTTPVYYTCIRDVVMSGTTKKVFSAGEPYRAWYQVMAGWGSKSFLVAFNDEKALHILLDPETDQEGEWFALHFKKEDSNANEEGKEG